MSLHSNPLPLSPSSQKIRKFKGVRPKPPNPLKSATDDNARPHTARHTQNILRVHNVNVLQLPARSPDLSPIEHLWDHLGRPVRERHDVNNIRDLERALQAEWVRIPLRVIRKLSCSMRRRCLAVLAANGGHTRY